MRVAAVDIGTNTARLLIADSRDEQLIPVVRLERITRLGEGLDSTGSLHPAAIERALAALAGFAREITAAGADRAGAVATAATRAARNGAEFVDAVARVLGFRPRVIAGDLEARLSFAGAARDRGLETPIAVIDVGGGSTEFVVGSIAPEYVHSVDIGSVRLTERTAARDLSPDAARDHLDALFAAVSPPVSPASVIGAGGTFTTLAGVHAGVPYRELVSLDGRVVAVAELQAVTDRLQRLSVAEIASIPAVVAGRERVLQAGALCAERAVARLRGAEVLISIADILDGVARELAR
jgi:exopolyphosphatase/guanosine-5'-triphosphate,3'-diphosphate pyrophosphatase